MLKMCANEMSYDSLGIDWAIAAKLLKTHVMF